MDGHLADLGDRATLEDAQSALVASRKSSGLSHAATWTSYQPDWWSADLTIA
jgi:hypothetical protein